MPFTLSHAAAAFPFRRTRLVLSAVIIGSFAPDFEYFVPFAHHGSFGHHPLGVLVLDLPLSLLVLWLFHRYAKEPLSACLPESARERLQLGPHTLSIDTFSGFALIVFSILVGIATHLLWDSFTHTGYWVTDHLPILSRNVDLSLFGWRPWYAILQYISSAVGILVLLLWSIHWYRTATPVKHQHDWKFLKRDRIALACSLLIALLAASVRAVLVGLPDGVHGAQRFMTIAAITVIAVFCFELVVYGVIRNHSRNTVNSVKLLQ
jgi:hypothetical protein